MKILCGESVRGSLVRLLEQEGHDVARVQDDLDVGFDDTEIIESCRETGRVVLTNDEDFFAFDSHPGVLFLDSQRTPPRDAVTAVQRIERHVDADTLENAVFHVPDGWI